jgi:hypothetical protein
MFLGCEGDSERGYGALLGDLLEERRQDIHLDVVLLRPGGGDPLTLVKRCEEYFARNARRGSPAYIHRALLLDSDLREHDRTRDQEATNLALKLELRMIWQEPCHEAFLLRHLDGFRDNRPTLPRDAMTLLQRAWPQYRKGMAAVRLREELAMKMSCELPRSRMSLRNFLGILVSNATLYNDRRSMQ